jgi:hypothetical protein
MSFSDERQPTPSPQGGLKKRVIPDPPEIPPSKGRQTLWFLVVLVVAAAATMAAIGTLNTLADPYGLAGLRLLPSTTTSDRSIKADLVEELRLPPQLIVLGSSRSMLFEPAYLKQKTGLRTFNAGLNAGGPADVWAMVHLIHDRFPDSKPSYLWFVDVESFVPFSVQRRTALEPRLARYIDGTAANTSWERVVARVFEDRATFFSWVTARESLRVLTHRKQAVRAQNAYRKRFKADGSYSHSQGSTRAVFAKFYLKSEQHYRDLYTNVYHKLDPTVESYFERTLGYMNAHGAKPLLVLTSISPRLVKVVGPLGWYQRHSQVVDFVQSLHGRYRFVFVDLTDIRTFKGDPRGFSDGVHLTTANTRRTVDYLVRLPGGIPR